LAEQVAYGQMIEQRKTNENLEHIKAELQSINCLIELKIGDNQ
jgi:hypothetical protein